MWFSQSEPQSPIFEPQVPTGGGSTDGSSDGTQSVQEELSELPVPAASTPAVISNSSHSSTRSSFPMRSTVTEDGVEVLALQPRRFERFRLGNLRRGGSRLESLPVPVENVSEEPDPPEYVPTDTVTIIADNRSRRGNTIQADTETVLADNRSLKVSDSPKEQDDDLVCEIDETGTRVCHPHKTERLEEKISTTKPGVKRRNAVIEALQEMRVRVYVVEGKSSRNSKDIVDHIRRVVEFVARENRIHERTGPLGYQRCLLYEDHEGRLFNLTFPKHAVGPAPRWEEYLDSFFWKRGHDRLDRSLSILSLRNRRYVM
jgi:hypothetical protein